MTFDPKYKIKHRLPPISRLSKYEGTPPPMVDDPPEVVLCGDWEKRCRLVYAYMMALKSGVVPPSQRRGLWFHAEGRIR